MGFPTATMRLATRTNDTGPLTTIPLNVLDGFFPGYSVISRFLLEVFGFDIGILVTLGILTLAITTSSTYVYNACWVAFRKYLTSTVYIEESDDIFADLMKYISENKVPRNARNVKAVTPWGHADDATMDSDDDDTKLGSTSGASSQDAPLFNFSMWEIRIPLRFEPYLGRHHFWHDSRIFFVDRYRESRGSRYDENTKDQEVVALSCVGRSTQPIKVLLEEVRVHALQRQETLTAIRRPCPKMERRWTSNPWSRIAVRPSRPISTVVLDTDQKIRILTDINEYLHPTTRNWYASRGIPYRRGYLFHGPPGTGKTSLSFALAGIFGLDIFVISLQEPTLTEEDLNSLFNNLPSRCIVLLEDIDTAGIKRPDSDDEDDEADKKKKTSEDAENKNDGEAKVKDEWSIIDVAKALQGVNRRERNAAKKDQGISLSGLLNAIDGVASHEGRILVMTTNHPEKMDEALIRPGRVDMQIAFALASRVQIREMFVRMYVTDATSSHRKHSKRDSSSGLDKQDASSASAAASALTKTGVSIARACAPPAQDTTKCPLMPLDQLYAFADAFVEKVPQGTFSPAEIQGFLLTRKSEPQRAVEEVDEWVRKKVGSETPAVEGTSESSTECGVMI